MAAAPSRSCRIALAVAVILIACFCTAVAQESTPSESDRERMLESMRLYAEQYITNLPNFICEQVTRQFEAGKKTSHWHTGDVLTSKLLFTHGEEQRSLELVNNRPIRAGMRSWRTPPLQTEGEFGVLLDRVFGAGSHAVFTWQGWDVVRGKRVAVFSFAVDAQHSTMRLRLSDLAEAFVPYHGTIYGDPESGAIWRVSDAATQLPEKLRTKNISTTIDYDNVAIGDKSYLLPIQASIWMTTNTNHVRNDLEFRNYRKFETDSVIKFASADTSPKSSDDPKQ